MPAQPQAITIRIFLADGTPEGVRLVERSQWTGIGVMCSRFQYPQARTREEFSRPGVYVLVGEDPDSPGGSIVYVGQAENASQRLYQHLKDEDKEFWESVVLFTNKDANFNSAHFRYLEAVLIDRARSAKRARLKNGNQPTRPRLSEPDTAEAEAFLSDMLSIYPLLGISAFDVVRSVDSRVVQPLSPTHDLYLRQAGQHIGQARYGVDGFVVLAGSLARREAVPSTPTSVRSLRGRLVEDGVLVPEDDLRLRFSVDYRFESPSGAASVLLGRTANGRLEWANASGITLKALQDSTAT